MILLWGGEGCQHHNYDSLYSLQLIVNHWQCAFGSFKATAWRCTLLTEWESVVPASGSILFHSPLHWLV